MRAIKGVVALCCATYVAGQSRFSAPAVNNFHKRDLHSFIQRDVVVIGGGSAGTYTSIRLQQMNKSVALIERNNRLGGHVNTYQVPGTNHTIDYGVQIFDDIPVVHNYFNHFDIPLVTVNQSAGAGPEVYADFSTGTPIPAFFVEAGSPSPNATAAAFLEYGEILGKYPYIVEGNGFVGLPNPVPDELLMTWGEFIEQYNLSAIAFETWVYDQGIGDSLNLPMLYQFKYFNNELVRDTVYGLYQANALQANQLLYDRALAELGSNVLLSSNVTGIRRRRDCVEVLVETPNGPVFLTASKLVIAIPPLLDSLSPFLDLNAEEVLLFGQFFNDYYWNAVIKDTGIPDNTSIVNIDPDAPYGLPPKPGAYAFDASGYPGLHESWYSSNSSMTDEEVQADILATLARLVKAFDFPPVNGTPEFVGFNAHNPFELQVSTEAIKAGFYTDLLGLQGKRNTYYTGAAWESQNSGAIWNYTEGHVLPQILASLG